MRIKFGINGWVRISSTGPGLAWGTYESFSDRMGINYRRSGEPYSGWLFRIGKFRVRYLGPTKL